MNAVTFHQVSKSYSGGLLGRQKIQAVNQVSFDIPIGSTFGLLGPNRAGKTTLVKMLLSLCRPSSGTINRLGQPITSRQSLARVGYMHENHAFPRYLTAREVMELYGGISGLPTHMLQDKVDNLLNRVGLSDRQNESISRFSKGMVQRLGLAQALLNEPDLLILDEPTEGLDLYGRQLLREVIREYHSVGKTVLLISHLATEIEILCDHAAVIVQGQLVYQGVLEDLKKQCGYGKTPNLEDALQRLYSKELAA